MNKILLTISTKELSRCNHSASEATLAEIPKVGIPKLNYFPTQKCPFEGEKMKTLPQMSIKELSRLEVIKDGLWRRAK